MARDYTGRLVKDKVEMSLSTKITLLVIGIIFMLAAITAPLVVLITKENSGSVAYGDFLYQYNIENGTVYYDIKKYIGSNTENVIIPSEYNGAPVIGILKNAFNGNRNSNIKKIKKITFDNTAYSGVRRIDSEAFVGLENLEGFTFPNHLTTIAQNAFVNCTIKGDVAVDELGSYYESSAGVVSKITISNNAFKNCQMEDGATLVVKKSSKDIVPSEILSTFGRLGASKVSLGQNVNIYNLGQDSFETFDEMTELTVYNVSAPTWATNTTQSNITGRNFNLDNCQNLAKVNVLYGNDDEVVSAFMQKFLYAPALTNVTFGEGIEKLGTGIFSCDGSSKGFEALQSIVVSGNVSFDADGKIVDRKGITVDVNVMKVKQLTSVKIYFDNASGENAGRKYKFGEEETSIINILKISNDRGHKDGGAVYSASSISANFSNMFANAATVRELVIDCNTTSGIEGITNNGLNGFFAGDIDPEEDYDAGDGFTLRFVGDGIGSLGSTIISETNISKIDVFGPTTESNFIFRSFNTTGGADASKYRDRRTYNAVKALSDIEYVLVFNVNRGDEVENIATLTLNAEDIESAISSSDAPVSINNVSNGARNVKIAHDQNQKFNEYEITNWVNYIDNDKTKTGMNLTLNADGTIDFVFEEDEVSPFHWYFVEDLSQIAVRTITFFAEWNKKDYVNVVYHDQFTNNDPDANHPQGLTYGETETIRVKYEGDDFSAIVKKGADLTRKNAMPVAYQAGYRFVGWYTEADNPLTEAHEGTKVEAADSLSDIVADIETLRIGEEYYFDLYAHYEQISYHVIYHAVGGIETDTIHGKILATEFEEAYGQPSIANSILKYDSENARVATDIANVTYDELFSLSEGLDIPWFVFGGWTLRNGINETAISNSGFDAQNKISICTLILGADYLNDSYLDEQGNVKLDSALFNGLDIHLYGIQNPVEVEVLYSIDAQTYIGSTSATAVLASNYSRLASSNYRLPSQKPYNLDADYQNRSVVYSANNVRTAGVNEQTSITLRWSDDLFKVGYHVGQWGYGGREKAPDTEMTIIQMIDYFAIPATSSNITINFIPNWTENRIRVQYYKNGGSYAGFNGDLVAYERTDEFLYQTPSTMLGGQIVYPYPEELGSQNYNLVRDGYDFVGWSMVQTTAKNVDITVKDAAAIASDVENGTFNIASVFAPGISVNGKTLLCYKYNGEANLSVINTEHETANADRIVILYAVWQNREYNVFFQTGIESADTHDLPAGLVGKYSSVYNSANASGFAYDDDQSVDANVVYGHTYKQLNAITLGKVGYYLEGFYTGENGTGTKVYNATVTNHGSGAENTYNFTPVSTYWTYNLGVSGDYVLYANWVKESINVVYAARFFADNAQRITDIPAATLTATRKVGETHQTITNSIVYIDDEITLGYSLSNGASEKVTAKKDGYVFIGYKIAVPGTDSVDHLGFDVEDAEIDTDVINDYVTDATINNKVLTIYADFRAKVYKVTLTLDSNQQATYGGLTAINGADQTYYAVERYYDTSNEKYYNQSTNAELSNAERYSYHVYVVFGEKFGTWVSAAEAESDITQVRYLTTQTLLSAFPTPTLYSGRFDKYTYGGVDYSPSELADLIVSNTSLEDKGDIAITIKGKEYLENTYNLNFTSSSANYLDADFENGYAGYSIFGTYAERNEAFNKSGTEKTFAIRQGASFTLTINFNNGYIVKTITVGAQTADGGASNTKTLSGITSPTGQERTISVDITGEGVTYYVSYNGAGATNTASAGMTDSTFMYGRSSDQFRTNAYEKIGYDFLGWDTNSAANTIVYDDEYACGQSGHLTTSSTTVIIYAVWGTISGQTKTPGQAYSYSVHYLPNLPTGESGVSAYADLTANYTASITLEVNNYDIVGYTNSGNWFYDSACLHQVGAISYMSNLVDVASQYQDTESNHEVNLYTQWTEKQYTIVFGSSTGSTGAVGQMTSVAYTTESITLPSVADGYTSVDNDGFSRIGHIAKGWSLTSDVIYSQASDVDCADGLVISLKDLVALAISKGKDTEGTLTIVLYAVWEVQTYTVNYSANTTGLNATAVSSLTPSSIASATMPYPSAYTLATNNFAMMGYTNSGNWFYDSACTLPVGTVNYMSDLINEAILNGVSGVETTRTIDLYTEWTAQDLASLTDENGDPISNVEFVVDLNIPTETNLAPIEPITGITWSFTNVPNGYTVNGEEATTTSIAFGSPIGTIPTFTATKTSYTITFNGWDLSGAVTQTGVSTQTLEAMVWEYTSSITATAQWTAEVSRYTMTLNLNGGQTTLGSTENITAQYLEGDALSALSTSILNLGRTLVGFNTNQNVTSLTDDGTGWYTSTDTMPANNLTVYAIWTDTYYNANNP
ncbi:MAG: leucine-rich repeat protein, partial [Clostridia bacterium]|nr:leucine-rich repeat protein [Clostridia bacterium]